MITYINARFLTQPLSGVQRYALELTTALDRRWCPRRNGRLIALMPAGHDRPTRPDWQTIELRALPGGQGHLWDQHTLLRATRGARLVSLCNAGPLGHPDHIVALHDAHLYDFPAVFSRRYRAWHQWLRPRLAARARRLITVSPASAQRLSHHLGVPASAFEIVPNAAEHLARVQPDPAVLKRLQLKPQQYFLAVGNQGPIKNLHRLVAAHARLPETAPPLVVAGGDLALLADARMAGTRRVICAGRVSDVALRALYEDASAFVCPSLSEGFGIPPLEAQVLGTPVLAARAAALPWVLGDGALWFDPREIGDITACLHRFLAMPAADKEAMKIKGRANTARFSWDQSAACLEKIVTERHTAPLSPSAP